MLSTALIGFTVAVFLVHSAVCCRPATIFIDGNAVLELEQLLLNASYLVADLAARSNAPAPFQSGRPLYESASGKEFIYHSHEQGSGIGRWLWVDEDGAVKASAQSWAVAPYLVNSQYLSDNAGAVGGWRTLNAAGDIGEPLNMEIRCSPPQAGSDVSQGTGLLFFDSSAALQPGLAGFYARQYLSGSEQGEGVLFMQIRQEESAPATYLFNLPSTPLTAAEAEQQCAAQGGEAAGSCAAAGAVTTTWLVGDRYGEDAGLAFATVTSDPAVHPLTALLTAAATQQQQKQQQQQQQQTSSTSESTTSSAKPLQWRFVDQSAQDGAGFAPWREDGAARLLHRGQRADVYEALLAARSLPGVPTGTAKCELEMSILFVPPQCLTSAMPCLFRTNAAAPAQRHPCAPGRKCDVTQWWAVPWHKLATLCRASSQFAA
jgi:hypothetical protein